MSQRTAIRRRRQMANGLRHLARLGRPIYPRALAKDKAAQRLKRQVEKERAMKARKKGK